MGCVSPKAVEAVPTGASPSRPRICKSLDEYVGIGAPMQVLTALSEVSSFYGEVIESQAGYTRCFVAAPQNPHLTPRVPLLDVRDGNVRVTPHDGDKVRVIEIGDRVRVGVPQYRREHLEIAVVIEPGSSVGMCDDNRVRATVHAVRLLRRAFGYRCGVIPAWRCTLYRSFMGCERLASLLETKCNLIVIEGGNMSVCDDTTFPPSGTPHADWVSFCAELLLCHSPHSSALQLFFGLAHQLVAQALVKLINRAHEDSQRSVFMQSNDLSQHDIPSRASGAIRSSSAMRHARTVESMRLKRLASMSPFAVLSDLTEAIGAIHILGEQITVLDPRGKLASRGYEHKYFAVHPDNTNNELAVVDLRRYEPPSEPSKSFPANVLDSYAKVSNRCHGILDAWLDDERHVAVPMRRGNKVNAAAILFVNWALQEIFKVVEQHQRYFLRSQKFRWLMNLPFGVEILCSAADVPVAALAIYYQDLDTGDISTTFSCQFHPELPCAVLAQGQEPHAMDCTMHSSDDDADGVQIFDMMLRFMRDECGRKSGFADSSDSEV